MAELSRLGGADVVIGTHRHARESQSAPAPRGERADQVNQANQAKGSAWAPLRNTVFRSLFFAQLGSNVGLWMQTVGAQWFLIERQSSPTVIALVQTASLAPSLALSLLAGALADQLDRRRLLIVVSACSGVAALVLTLLAWSHTLEPWSLLMVSFVLGCGAALSAPAWQAVQPELVPREQIPAASSLGSVTINVARAVGPALAGFVIAVAGPVVVFALNAVSFIGILAALVGWRRPRPLHTTDREHLGESLLSGLRYVRSGPIVRRIMVRSALFAIPASAFWALLPVASAAHLRLGASGYGVVLAMLGVGALVGVVVLPSLRSKTSANTLLVLSAVAYAVGVVGVAVLSLWPALALLVLAGTAWIATLTTLNASIQLSLAPWVRARGMAIYLLAFMGGQAVGSFGWGALATRVGYRPALLAAAGCLGLVAVSVRWWPLRSDTGVLDRSRSLCWPTPTLIFEPVAEDGPVLVAVSYRVVATELDEFVAAMRAVEKSRRRTGAIAWRIYRSGEDAELVLEQFVVRSWAEFRRQREERWTGSDDRVLSRTVERAGGLPAREHHYVTLPTR